MALVVKRLELSDRISPCKVNTITVGKPELTFTDQGAGLDATIPESGFMLSVKVNRSGLRRSRGCGVKHIEPEAMGIGNRALGPGTPTLPNMMKSAGFKFIDGLSTLMTKASPILL